MALMYGSGSGPPAQAMLAYNGIQITPNALGDGCQGGLARPRYHALSGSTARAPAAAVTPTAALVSAYVTHGHRCSRSPGRRNGRGPGR